MATPVWGVAVMNTPNVYADGFGNWHAYIPNTAAGTFIAARRLIRAELVQREQRRNETLTAATERLTAYVLEHVQKSVTQDRAGFTHYSEEG